MTDDRWTAGYHVARAFYRDTAQLTLDKIRARISEYHAENAHRTPTMFVLDDFIADLQAILDTAKEPHV